MFTRGKLLNIYFILLVGIKVVSISKKKVKFIIRPEIINITILINFRSLWRSRQNQPED